MFKSNCDLNSLVKAVCLLRFFHKPHTLIFPSQVLELGRCMLGMEVAAYVHTYQFVLNQCFIIKCLDVEIFDVVSNSLARFSLWNVYHSIDILLIYLNDLCCFRILHYVLVLQCGNSLEDCCVFPLGCYSWSTTEKNRQFWHVLKINTT